MSCFKHLIKLDFFNSFFSDSAPASLIDHKALLCA